MTVDYFTPNNGAFTELTPFTRTRTSHISIPRKYHETFVDAPRLEPYDDLDAVPYSPNMVAYLRDMYVASFWLDSWYTEACDVFTLHTEFYPWEAPDIKFTEPKFVRLNSVSMHGEPRPVKSLDEARRLLDHVSRTRMAMEHARSLDLPVLIAVRPFVDMSLGLEFRCFIFANRLTAISSNDDRICPFSPKSLIERCQALLDRAREFLPFEDCVMDVYLSDKGEKEGDMVIEFNSYGAWANAGSGLFHWVEDEIDLMSAREVTVRVNTTDDL